MLSNPLRSLVTEPRPAHVPERVWRDGALLALLAGSAITELAFRPEVRAEPWLGIVFVLALGVALWLRRTSPSTVVLLMFGAASVVSLVSLAGVVEPPLLHSTAWILVLPYALVRWGSGREIAVGVPVILGSAVLGAVADFTGVADLIAGFVILLFTCAIGATVRYRTHARLREVDQAKLQEREQLARELHDTVAHHVSGIAIQAQAGRAVAATHPEKAVTALEVIEEAASRTLDELRAIVGLLRDGTEPDLAPQPGIADLDRLGAAASERPTVDVELVGDLDGLSPALEAAIYRIAQESITNAVKHSRHATRIHVHVAGDDDAVRLTVRDDGEGRTVDRHAVGYGLIGMTERASLLGGTLDAGPGEGRGWTVEAALPRGAGGS
jgi:signal transduction histidine kinase